MKILEVKSGTFQDFPEGVGTLYNVLA